MHPPREIDLAPDSFVPNRDPVIPNEDLPSRSDLEQRCHLERALTQLEAAKRLIGDACANLVLARTPGSDYRAAADLLRAAMTLTDRLALTAPPMQERP